MNRAGGRCHDNAHCESMWGRMKTELLYKRYYTENMTTDELKELIWRYSSVTGITEGSVPQMENFLL